MSSERFYGWVTRQQLAEKTGIPERTLLYWASINLIDYPLRQHNQEAIYPPETIKLVTAFRRAQKQGHKSSATLKLIRRYIETGRDTMPLTAFYQPETSQ